MKKTTLEQILFPVEKKALSELTGMEAFGENAYAVVGDIGGKKVILNTCSERYNLRPNSEIFPVVEQMATDRGLNFKSRYSQIDNSKFYGELSFTDEKVKIKSDKDLVAPRIVITHSYNGKLNYNLLFGAFRLICSNGLVIPMKGFEEINMVAKGKHTPKLDESLEMFFQKLEMFLEKFPKIVKQYDTLADKAVLDPKARIEEVQAAIKGYPKTVVDLAMQILTHEMDVLGYKQANDWLIYNAMNESLYSDSFKVHPEYKIDYDQSAMNYLLTGIV